MLNQAEQERLRGQVALVTGGSVGIGLATAKALACEGAEVTIVGRNEDRLETARADLAVARPAGSVTAISADVRSETDMDRVVSETLDAYGRIDILVASAGILRPSGSSLSPLASTPVRAWDEVLGINLRGLYLASRAVLPTMMQQRSGHIINISSTSGRKGYAFDSAYCASKFAAIGMTESLAQEVASYGIKVHVLLPGAVDTPMWEQNGPFKRPSYALPAERVAQCVVYLACMPDGMILDGPIVEPFGKALSDDFVAARKGVASLAADA